MSKLTRDGTVEPVLRDRILRRKRGQGKIHFPCSANHEQDWQPYIRNRALVQTNILIVYDEKKIDSYVERKSFPDQRAPTKRAGQWNSSTMEQSQEIVFTQRGLENSLEYSLVLRVFCCLKKNLNASRPSEHPPDRGLLKKNLNASRSSEHPPVRGKMSKRLGRIIGCKYKTFSWHLNGFPDGSIIGSRL